MAWRWVWMVAAAAGCGPTVETPVASGTESASSGVGESTETPPPTATMPTASMTSQGSGSTTDGPQTGDATGDTWPLCVPEAVEFWFEVGELIEFEPGEIAANCDVASVDADDFGQLVLLENCMFDDGDATGGFPITIHNDEPLVLDFLLGQNVDVSYVLADSGKELYEQWYSLRDPEGRLLLAAFFTYADRVEPTVDGTPLPGWLDPFSIRLGEFVCPPEPGCEDDDTPQRALAVLGDGASTIEVVDGTIGQFGTYTLILEAARAPDACEGRPSTAALQGLLYYLP